MRLANHFPLVLLTLLLALLSPPARAASATIPLNFPPGPLPLSIRADFHLQQILQMDERAETFTFSGVLALIWKDPRQAFDPIAEGSPERLFQGSFQFDEVSPGWYPQVVLVNDADSFTTTGVILRVLPDGTCYLLQSINATARTNYNMTRVPFDSHRLEAMFEILGYSDAQVLLRSTRRPADSAPPDLTFPQWTLSDIQTTTRLRTNPFVTGNPAVTDKSSVLVLSLTATRQPFFIIRLLALPLLLIVLLSFSVFWMDRTAVGDRVGVSFIGLLTSVAYQNLISDYLPHISYVTLMNAFINISFLIMCATVVINLVVGGLGSRGRHDRAHRIDRICRWFFPLSYLSVLTAIAVIIFYFF